MKLLSYGEFYGKYVDAVINNDIAGRAVFATPVNMARAAGLVTGDEQNLELTYDRRSKDFRLELGSNKAGEFYRVVVPEGVFPELDRYAAVDGMGGDDLRYANEGE